MTDSANTVEPRRASGRNFVRRVLYPVVVIVAIAGVIWWLETRDGGGTSPITGEAYGVRDLPVALVPEGANVEAAVGSLAPDYLLENVDGGESRLSDFRGQPVVLNFWATWCLPCRQEMPQLVQAYEKYKDDGLVIIGLNMQQGRGVIEPFAEERGVEYPLLIDRDGDLGDEYRLLGLPTTYFIDSDGVIQSVFTGPLEDEVDGTDVQGAIAQTELEERIEELLVADANVD